MRLPRSILVATSLLVVLALASCDRGYTNVNIAGGTIRLHNDHVTVQANGAANAEIDADGNLRIDSRLVSTTDDQRALLKRYYAEANGIARQSIAIGKAGGTMAGGMIGDVAENLFSGHPDRIDAAVQKRTDKLLDKVEVICTSLGDLQATQDRISATLPAFRPYARLHASDIDDCQESVAEGRRRVVADSH